MPGSTYQLIMLAAVIALSDMGVRPVQAADERAAWVETAKLLPSDGWGLDKFGESVSLYGDTALVGAVFDDDHGFNSGSAYVLVRKDGAWTQQAKLLASDGMDHDNFGQSVSLYGDTALVGAVYDDDNGAESGSAYVFVRSGEIWTQQAKLVAGDGELGDYLGWSVSLHGDTALAGAWGDDDHGADSGSAYVFSRSGGVWSQEAKLLASDTASEDHFGVSVSLAADTALVGAHGGDENGIASGSAYVFVRRGSAWTRKAKLVPSDGEDYDGFGGAVSLHGDTALVGALGVDDHGANAGSAYVFARSGELWTQQAKLLASDGEYGDWLGTSVSLFGDTALVGATGDDDNGPGSGSEYVFVRSGGKWTERGKLFASDGEAGDRFGISVSLFEDTALVGAPHRDEDTGPSSGSAYVFFGGPIFEDGFESGDTSAWSSTVPP